MMLPPPQQLRMMATMMLPPHLRTQASAHASDSIFRNEWRLQLRAWRGMAGAAAAPVNL